MRAVSDEKSSTLDDLEGQYCNRNCIGCSESYLARRFYCEKSLRKLRPIILVLFTTTVYN